jgi:hypothetical protein
MFGFKRKPRATEYLDPLVAAVRDPAAQEALSRLQGRCDQLEREQAYCKNNLAEIRERLVWTVQIPDSPFERGDRVAREIESGVKPPDGTLKLEPPSAG